MKFIMKKNMLFGHTARSAVAQILGVGLCTTVLLLFVALTYSQITLPHYTAKYDQKDTQQVVNLLITVVATLSGILLSHCRRVTNEAETRHELRNEELTLPRLHIHFEAAGGSKLALGAPAFYNRDVWRLVAVYFLAMLAFGFLHSVLSVIFVIEGIISSDGVQEATLIPLSNEIPWMYKGENIDVCSEQISDPGCYYEQANTALSSQLITYLPYTVGGVTFEPPNGTMGLPKWAMEHFTNEISTSTFDDEHRQYCLPVLDPHIIRCTEDEFNQEQAETVNGDAKFKLLDVFKKDDSGTYTSGDADEITTSSMYEIYIPKDIPMTDAKIRVADQGQGTMLVRMNPNKEFWNTTIIAGSNDPDEDYGYASLLYELMYGAKPDPSLFFNGTFYFAAKCEMTSIMYRDNYLSSWRKVDFTFKNGISRANVTEERCPNARGNYTSGFRDLYFDIEAASAVLSSTDGYPKLFNINDNSSTVGTNIYQDMSRLDAIVNQMYAITQTGWSGSNWKYVQKEGVVPEMYSHPVMMTRYPHLYVIRINWTPTTYIGLVLSLLITLNAYVLAGRWLKATYGFGFDPEDKTWNLLHPVDLMAYTLAAYQDLVRNLSTVDNRRMAMRGKIRTLLRERPLDEGTQSLIDLVNGEVKRRGSSPMSEAVGHSDRDAGPRSSAGEEEKGPEISVVEAQRAD